MQKSSGTCKGWAYHRGELSFIPPLLRTRLPLDEYLAKNKEPLSEQDLGHIRSWIASDDPMKCIAEAFDREGVEIGESLDARRRGSSFAPELENDNTKGSTMSLLNDSSATSENVR